MDEVATVLGETAKKTKKLREENVPAFKSCLNFLTEIGKESQAIFRGKMARFYSVVLANAKAGRDWTETAAPGSIVFGPKNGSLGGALIRAAFGSSMVLGSNIEREDSPPTAASNTDSDTCFEQNYAAFRQQAIEDFRSEGNMGPYAEEELVPMGIRNTFRRACYED